MRKINLGVVFFYMSFSLLIFETFFGNMDFLKPYTMSFSIIEMVLLLISFAIQSKNYSIKTIVLIGILVVLALLSFIRTRNSNIALIILYIISSKNIEFEKFVKFVFKTKVVFLLLLLFLLLIGVAKNTVAYRNDGIARNTFGFESPNTLGMILLSICMEYTYIKRKKINGFTYIIFILISIFLLELCNSRTSAYCIILLTIFLIIRNKMSMIKKILPYIIPIFIIMSFFTVIQYGKGALWAKNIDKILSTRILCGWQFFNNYKINLLGNYFVKANGWLGYIDTLDNAYLNLVIRHGVLFTLIIIVYTAFLIKNIKEDDKVLEVIFFMWFICGFLERAPFIILYNIFWLYGSNILFNRKTKRKESIDERKSEYNRSSI